MPKAAEPQEAPEGPSPARTGICVVCGDPTTGDEHLAGEERVDQRVMAGDMNAGKLQPALCRLHGQLVGFIWAPAPAWRFWSSRHPAGARRTRSTGGQLMPPFLLTCSGVLAVRGI